MRKSKIESHRKYVETHFERPPKERESEIKAFFRKRAPEDKSDQEISLRLPDRQLRWLDAGAVQGLCTRNQFIRKLIDLSMAEFDIFSDLVDCVELNETCWLRKK